jgi:hypothetical protein
MMMRDGNHPYYTWDVESFKIYKNVSKELAHKTNEEIFHHEFSAHGSIGKFNCLVFRIYGSYVFSFDI